MIQEIIYFSEVVYFPTHYTSKLLRVLVGDRHIWIKYLPTEKMWRAISTALDGEDVKELGIWTTDWVVAYIHTRTDQSRIEE